jgi:hypothetical protein
VLCRVPGSSVALVVAQLTAAARTAYIYAYDPPALSASVLRMLCRDESRHVMNPRLEARIPRREYSGTEALECSATLDLPV